MISPLLSLGADQTRKLLKVTVGDISITAFHLDELTPIEIGKIFQGIKNLSAIKTVVLITSPQTLLSRTIYLILDHIIKSSMIRFVVYDEIHLAAHCGSSFREEFGRLKDGFFLKLPPSMPMLKMDVEKTRLLPYHRIHLYCHLYTR